jgi:hypothetical protein
VAKVEWWNRTKIRFEPQNTRKTRNGTL